MSQPATLDLEPGLMTRLRQLRVRVDVRDENTILLRDVPADARCFNKTHTNLLVKRPQEGFPFVVCVDEDLEYTGTDAALVRAFARARRQQGWRILYVETAQRAGLAGVLERALTVLGCEGGEPALHRGGLLAALAAEPDDPSPTIGRAEEIERVTACVLAWRTRLPVVVGESGAGKTNLLSAVAERLARCRPAWRLLRVDLGAALAGAMFESERENLLAALLKEAAAPHTVVALEHIDLAILAAPLGRVMLSDALDRGVKLIGAALPTPALELEIPPLARRLEIIELAPLEPGQAVEVVLALRGKIAAHHGIRIDAPLARPIVERSLSLAGHLPGKAVALLDCAAATAALAGATDLDLYHIYTAATRLREKAA